MNAALVVESTARALEQRVALLEDLVDLAAQRVVARVRRHQCVIEELPALGRAALHQLEVVGREHGDAQHAEQVAGPLERLPVDEDPVAARRHQLRLDEDRSTLALPLRPDTARSAPWRISASVGAPRNDASVASHAMASSTFVFPCPLSPSSAVSPGASSSSADVYDRTSVSHTRSSARTVARSRSAPQGPSGGVEAAVPTEGCDSRADAP